MTPAIRALAVLGLAACAAAARPVAPPPSARLSSLALLTAEGQRVTLGELARGRPVVIDLFATWCEPCREQLAHTDAMARRPPGDVLVIAVDVGEERALVERYARRQGLTLPIYLDPELRFQDSLGSDVIPLLVVLDRAQRIVHRGSGLDASAREVIARVAATPAEDAEP